MVTVIAQGLVSLVALIQIGISIGEIFLWKKVYKRLEPKIVFNQPAEVVNVAPIVMNAGLYNSFLAAGLIWGLIAQANALVIQTFFLACVLVAGIFGFLTLEKRTVLILQAVPSLVALIAIWSVNRSV
jgi:putative membrane protein